MVEVEITMRGVEVGDKTRRSWRFVDFDHPVPTQTAVQRRDFLHHLWSNITNNLKILGIEDCYGITITKILDCKVIYP